MDRGARSAGMRHSHNETKKVADMLSELLVEQIHTTPKKGQMSCGSESVKKTLKKTFEANFSVNIKV